MRFLLIFSFLLLFVFSCIDNRDLNSNSELDSNEDDQEIYEEIPFIDTLNNLYKYQVLGFEFFSEYKWFVSMSKPNYGPDFAMFSHKVGEHELEIYSGNHPQIFDPGSRYYPKYKIVQEFDSIMKVDKYYSEKGYYSSYKYVDRDSFITVYDSAIYEAYRLDTIDLLIRKPLENKTGDMDVIRMFNTEFGMYDYKLHFMFRDINHSETDAIIECLKTFESIGN